MRCDFCHRTIKIKIKVVNDFKNKQKRVKHAATQIHHQLEVHQFILLTADSLGSQPSQRVTGLTQSDNKLSHPPVAKITRLHNQHVVKLLYGSDMRIFT